MKLLITCYKALFFIITNIVAVVALIACVTDVQTTTRMFWIGAAITCIGVVSSWKGERV